MNRCHIEFQPDGLPGHTGDLKTIADFANSARRITGVPNGAPLPTSPFNTLAGAAAAHGTVCA